MSVRLGDVLEWLAGLAATVAAFQWQGTALALVVAAVALAYFAQVYDGPLPPKRQKSKDRE